MYCMALSQLYAYTLVRAVPHRATTILEGGDRAQAEALQMMYCVWIQCICGICLLLLFLHC